MAVTSAPWPAGPASSQRREAGGVRGRSGAAAAPRGNGCGRDGASASFGLFFFPYWIFLFVLRIPVADGLSAGGGRGLRTCYFN